jgi:hypothetical protein
MADALDRPISFDDFDREQPGSSRRCPDIRNGSADRVVAETHSKLRFVLGPLSYERIRRTTIRKRFPQRRRKPGPAGMLTGLSLSVLANYVWEVLKALFSQRSC